MQKIPSYEIAPEILSFSREEFINSMALDTDNLSVLSACNKISVPDPICSKSTLRRIGEIIKRATFLLIGYKEEVTCLSKNFDLIEKY